MRFRVFLDAGSGALLWPGDREAGDAYGIPTDLARLGVPAPLVEEAAALCRAYDEAFPWDDPAAGGMAWTREEAEAFRARVEALAEALRRALGRAHEVELSLASASD